jgi:UPF0716 family protein affecting phage T7 exclusion
MAGRGMSGFRLFIEVFRVLGIRKVIGLACLMLVMALSVVLGLFLEGVSWFFRKKNAKSDPAGKTD